MYMARQLSFAGVTFEIRELPLAVDFVEMYNSAVSLVSCENSFMGFVFWQEMAHLDYCGINAGISHGVLADQIGRTFYIFVFFPAPSHFFLQENVCHANCIFMYSHANFHSLVLNPC